MLGKNTHSMVWAVLIFVLPACTLIVHEKTAALLPIRSEQARTEIVELLSQVLGGKTIPIADDVFQHSSRLLLGQAAVVSPTGIKVLNHDSQNVLVFELIKQADHCLLRRISNGQEWRLKTKLCFKVDSK